MPVEQAAKTLDSSGMIANEPQVRVPTSGQLEDAATATAIAELLLRSRLVPADTVWAIVAASHVTLEGEVERWSQRDAIERAVQSVPGIKGLKNLVTVQPETVSREVARAILEARASSW
jgi:osmotically-inducible protein OsmY